MAQNEAESGVAKEGALPQTDPAGIEGLEAAVQDLIKGNSAEQRDCIEWVAERGKDVLSLIPKDVLPATIEHLVERNGWISCLTMRMAEHALERDLTTVKAHLVEPIDPAKIHVALLDAALPAPDRRDGRFIICAIGAQVLGAAAVLVLNHFLKRHVVDWIILAQATALFVSTFLVGECRHVDGRGWGRFMGAATAINLLLSAIVLVESNF